MSLTEQSIRDNLANNLEALESGLTLIEAEHPLPNPFGSKGFIDILAKDTYGNRVIIELKRTNQAARQAVHEIFKYIALFRERNRIADHKLRCFLVSTEWHELRVPFAELRRSSKLQVDGFLLTVDPAGGIIGAKKQEPVVLADRMRPFRKQAIFLFENETSRDMAVPGIAAAFESVGGIGAFLVKQTYSGSNPGVIYRFGAYLAAVVIDPAIRDELGLEYKTDVEDDYDLSNEELELGIQDLFGARVLQGVDHTWSDFEIGYPEKFYANLQCGWEVTGIVRIGIVPAVEALDDLEVATLISGTEGENLIHFAKVTTPRLHLDWIETKSAMLGSLKGNGVWSAACRYFADRVQAAFPEATVAFSIYNPLNIVTSLFKLYARSDPAYMPYVEIVASDPLSKQLIFLAGAVVWDGITVVESVDSVFPPPIGSLENFMLMNVVHEVWRHDEAVMERHGLSYTTVVGDLTAEGVSINYVRFQDDPIDGLSIQSAEAGEDLASFCAANREYLSDLCNMLSEISTGL